MNRSAFTLVELSIVLVILGLLVGGVLSGQSLIRAAELRAVTTEFNQWITATNAFKDKYMALPGDMTNATAFWQEEDADPTTCFNTQSTGTATCNGDGNGRIGTSYSGESYRYWQHLSNAGLIEGTYSGASISSHISTYGVNIPGSRLSGAGWFVTFTNAVTDNSGVLPKGSYGNIFFYGQAQNGGSSPPETLYPILKAEEAYNIDKKMDDGSPINGNIRTFKHDFNFSPNCMNEDNDNYDLRLAETNCMLVMLPKF